MRIFVNDNVIGYFPCSMDVHKNTYPDVLVG